MKPKLAAKTISSFKIVAMITSNVFKLALPRTLSKLHSSFNIDLQIHFVPGQSGFNVWANPKSVPVVLEEETGNKFHIVESL